MSTARTSSPCDSSRSSVSTVIAHAPPAREAASSAACRAYPQSFHGLASTRITCSPNSLAAARATSSVASVIPTSTSSSTSAIPRVERTASPMMAARSLVMHVATIRLFILSSLIVTLPPR